MKYNKLTNNELDGLKLIFKFGESRGRETYGWGTCSLNIQGSRVYSCNGGGYDFSGTCLGEWMNKQFRGELQALEPSTYTTGLEFTTRSGFYGLNKGADFVKGKRVTSLHVDGGCGFESMRAILKALGWSLVSVHSDRKQSIYRLEAVKA